MATLIKCWEVSKDTGPKELQASRPRLEEHLEDWLEQDITMLSPDLVVIGRQIENIDLLAVDSDGRLVVIELKRDQVPREAIAQAVDYASLVSAWLPSQVAQLSEEYFSEASRANFKSLEDAFLARFEKNLEDISLNNAQRVILVGVRVEPGVQRMVDWLSENGVDINVALFTFHALGERRYILARTFVLSEEVTSARSAARSGRRRPISREEFDAVVSRKGLKPHIEAFDDLRSHPVFCERWGLDGLDLEVEIPREEGRPLRRKGVQLLISLSKPGVLLVGISTGNLAERLQMPIVQIEKALEAFSRNPNVRWRYDIELGSPEQTRALVSVLLPLLECGLEDVGKAQ
jgi:hypothetical protein